MRYLSREGFTFVELIMVLLIAGIAVSIVTVSISKSYGKSVMKEQAARIHGTLRHARDTSLMERVPVTFSLDAERGRFWLEKDGSPAGAVKSLPGDLALEGESIVFLPKGNSTGGRIALTRPDGRGYLFEVDPVTGTATVSGI